MQRLTSDGIEAKVKLIVAGYVATSKQTPSQAEQAVIDASIDLVVNFLVNFNDIAEYCNNACYTQANRP